MIVAACSVAWTVDTAGAVSCAGDLVQVAAPLWTMTADDVGSLLSATLLLFAVAFAVRQVVRFVISSYPGRG
jgi:hypothetical protein